MGLCESKNKDQVDQKYKFEQDIGAKEGSDYS